jgi:putative flavoprotein involved in K+ transport
MTTQFALPQPTTVQSGLNERFGTVIIGAGQSGLALGYHLARRQESFVILDGHKRVGDRWREHYDSLRLYTPAKYDGLPGMRFPAPPYSFPTGRQMGDYLEAYATRFALPVRGGITVDRVSRDGESYLISAGEQCFVADNVVIATGAQQLPKVPEFATALDAGIHQLHSSEYRNPAQLRPGGVLVVGASHSGGDIALEASRSHHTWLAGPVRGQLPFQLEGRPARSIMKVLWFAANYVLTERTPIGRKMRDEVRTQGGPLLRVRMPDLAAAGVEYDAGKVTGVRDGLPQLENGELLDVSNVIWCTGFRRDDSWIELPIFGSDGWPFQQRGVVADAPGLYFLGLKFQYAFRSMLIGGVGRDASYVARHIRRRNSRMGNRSGLAQVVALS